MTMTLIHNLFLLKATFASGPSCTLRIMPFRVAPQAGRQSESLDEVEGMYPLRGSERHIGDRAFQGWALAEIRIPHPSVKARKLLAPSNLSRDKDSSSQS